jgi:hypothetical protein
MVSLDRSAASGDGIVELAGSHYVFAGETVLPENPASFTHADLRAQSG